MLKCDINEVMDEIKGMTIREKNKYLEKFHDELLDFASNVDELKEKVNDDYYDLIKKQIRESLQSFVNEKHWKEEIGFDNEACLQKRNGKTLAWIVLSYLGSSFIKDEDSSWRVNVITGFSQIGNILPGFLDKLSLPSKEGTASINIPVEESEIVPTLKRIVSAWCGEKDGDARSGVGEKDVCDITGKA